MPPPGRTGIAIQQEPRRQVRELRRALAGLKGGLTEQRLLAPGVEHWRQRIPAKTKRPGQAARRFPGVDEVQAGQLAARRSTEERALDEQIGLAEQEVDAVVAGDAPVEMLSRVGKPVKLAIS